jgi:hypothetical protein
MTDPYHIPEPFQFNPLKHHLAFIREFIFARLNEENGTDIKILVRELRRIGTSVMDVYTGSLSVDEICKEVIYYLESKRINSDKVFSAWTGKDFHDFRIITLSDASQWTLKYHDNKARYAHLFPARASPHSFRVKANTMKSAILYYILIGKDFITGNDLNQARVLLGLSPVKEPVDSEAITEMIELIRN